MKIYSYDKETKEFLSENEARVSPLEKDKFLVPANSTDKPPLEIKKGFAICFNEDLKAWEYIVDYRGVITYHIVTKMVSKIDYLGPTKSDFTELKPGQFDKWSVDMWVEDTVLRSKYDRSRAKQTGEAYPLNGTDYMVPFMKNDGDAVMQVNAAFQMGLVETKIHFSNDTIMPIKATEFQEFAVWFVNKRNSFFI